MKLSESNTYLYVNAGFLIQFSKNSGVYIVQAIKRLLESKEYIRYEDLDELQQLIYIQDIKN